MAAEEPLEIRVVLAGGQAQPVSVTMRTPGSDFELAAGFLYGEGMLSVPDEVEAIRYCVPSPGEAQQYNVVSVDLRPGAGFDPERLRRNFYTTSSCGVCGKASIEAVMGEACRPVADTLRIDAGSLLALPPRLRAAQPLFERTGGLHAAGLFAADGTLLEIREDVGRHNALDKVIGASFLRGDLPLSGRIVLVSGRLSFELVQKAARAGVEILAGVSAPSSLAVELASSVGMTLVGFLRQTSFNVYSRPHRLQLPGRAIP